MLTRVEFVKFNKMNKYTFSSFNAVKTAPPSYIGTTIPDMNYIFSINTTQGVVTETIQDYVSYVIKYFSLIIFSGLVDGDISLGFQEIEARVGTVYTDLLNRLDFLQYNQYQENLDEYRIAIFNHIFFILIQQTGSGIYDTITTNEYFKLTSDDKRATTNQIKSNDVFKMIINANNKRYLKIRSKEDLDKMSMNSVNLVDFPSLTNITADANIVDTLSTNYDEGDLPDTTLLNPFVDNVDTNIEILQSNLLQNYIKTTSFKSKEMEKYYMPGQLSECERLKRQVKAEFTKYAKIIKNEIYRIVFIPIVIYIVYNMYYMFFFRDAAGRVKYETGEYINEGFFCKNPLFPDWETYFHTYDNHNADLVIEYIFKPAKMIYTLLNAFKATIRTLPFIGIDAGIIPPYIYLFATLLIFNDVSKKYGDEIMDFYNNFYNTLSLPNTTTWNGWKETAKAVIITFFSLSIVKDVCGFNWHEMLQLFSVTVLDEDKLEEPKQRSWVEWLTSPPYLMIFMIFKSIIFILYWIFKYSLAIQMIPIALFIAVIYFTYTCFFAIYNNCDSECDYFSKRELIDRIIYTRLYDVPKKLEKWYEWGLYLFKTVCWLLMVFMIELLSIWILKEGLNKITSNIGGSKYADGLKLILITIYSCIFCLIGLWCFYKYTFKLPIMETFFSIEKDDPEPKKPEETDEKYKLKMF
jgi:hypothetical protein